MTLVKRVGLLAGLAAALLVITMLVGWAAVSSGGPLIHANTGGGVSAGSYPAPSGKDLQCPMGQECGPIITAAP